MPCFHPLLAQFVSFKANGKPEYKIIGQYCGIKHDPRDKVVPCGQCVGCRLDKSRQWADRMMLELDHSKSAVFITLTYDQEHVPLAMVNDDGTATFTVVKRDCQLFLKRLRKFFCDRELRFYLSAEYGSTTWRPHYHAIIFGLSLADFGLYDLTSKSFVDPDGYNEFRQPYYGSFLLDYIWKNGFTSVSPVSWQTCAYVARYCMKKQTGDAALIYALNNQSPEFALMSLKPGLGAYFIEDHPDVFDSTYIYIDDPNGVKHVNRVSLPKYFISKLELIDPDRYAKIKSEREAFADNKLFSELLATDLDVVDYLETKERIFKAKVGKLKRK